MFRTVLIQVAATVIAAALGGLLAGTRGVISAALGGGVCVLPNLLFAVLLKTGSNRRAVHFTLNFVLGEIIKLVAIVGLLYMAATLYADVHWPSLMIGLGLATQALFLVFWKKH